MRRSRAFTLPELLVVLGIVVLLISILLGVLAKAREQACQVACASNQRQILAAVLMYTDANKGWMPVPIYGWGDALYAPSAIWMTADGMYDWADGHGTLWPYLAGGPLARQRVFNCPSDGADPRLAGDDNGLPDPANFRNFSYNFTDQLIVSLPVGPPSPRPRPARGVRINKIIHPDHKILVLEQENPRYCEGTINVIRGSAPDGTGTGGVYPLLTIRHSGRANEGFADGHVELFDGSVFDGSTTVGTFGVTLATDNDAYYRFYYLFPWGFNN